MIGSSRDLCTGMLLLLLASNAGSAAGQCPDFGGYGPAMQSEVSFSRRFEGTYRPGEPYDVVTIRPDGGGETFADAGIRIRIRLICIQPDGIRPFAGIPAEYIMLWSPALCLSTSKTADGPTDADGWTEFSGSIAGGGCGESLQVYADGIYLGTIPVKVNSPDVGQTTMACTTDGSDLAALSTVLGVRTAYSICFDFNESGAPVDSGDLAYFASALGASSR